MLLTRCIVDLANILPTTKARQLYEISCTKDGQHRPVLWLSTQEGEGGLTTCVVEIDISGEKGSRHLHA